MKRLGKWIIYILFFILSLVAFTPKKYLYYQFEHMIQKRQLIISDETAKDNLFSLSLSNGILYFNDIDTIHFQHISFYPLLFLNILDAKNIESSKTLPLSKQIKIHRLFIYYSLLFPTKATIKGEGDFGNIDGWIDLLAHKGKILFYTQQNLAQYSLPVKKVKKGLYSYEFSF